MKWSEVVGHTETKALLISAIHDGRIPHAQLILGKEGSGNLPLARAYIQYILCVNRVENDSCGVCPSCTKVSQMAHPDVHYAFPVVSTKPESPTKSKDKMNEFRKAMMAEPYMSHSQWVEFCFKESKNAIINARQCEEIAEDLRLKPFEAPYKFMVIWLPEKINYQAAPKLLKIIEEPPPKTIFLLVSNNDEQILSTIKSRTQLIRLKQISDFDMMEGLMSKYNLPIDKAREIINIADGNFAQALELAEYNEDHEQNLEWFLKWINASYQINIPILMALGSELNELSKDRQKSFFNFVLHMIRESLVNRFDESLMRTTEQEFNAAVKFKNYIYDENIEVLSKLLDESILAIDRNANFKILFMDISLQLKDLIKAPAKQA